MPLTFQIDLKKSQTLLKYHPFTSRFLLLSLWLYAHLRCFPIHTQPNNPPLIFCCDCCNLLFSNFYLNLLLYAIFYYLLVILFFFFFLELETKLLKNILTYKFDCYYLIKSFCFEKKKYKLGLQIISEYHILFFV